MLAGLSIMGDRAVQYRQEYRAAFTDVSIQSHGPL